MLNGERYCDGAALIYGHLTLFRSVWRGEKGHDLANRLTVARYTLNHASYSLCLLVAGIYYLCGFYLFRDLSTLLLFGDTFF